MKPLFHFSVGKKSIFWSAILLAYAAVYWRRLLLSGMIPFDGDLPFFYLPSWAIGKKLLLDGFYLLWDPYRNMGQPFLASPQNHALYPLRFISPWTDFVSYERVFLIVHLIWAAGFGFLLGKKWWGDSQAAGLCALGFGFNGFFLWRFVYQSDFATMAWLPAVLYFLITRRPLWLGLGLLFQGLAGFVPFLFLTYLLLIVVVLTDSDRRPAWVCLIQGTLLGLGLGAVQIFPFLELFGQAERKFVLDAAVAVRHPLPWRVLAADLLIPASLHGAFNFFSRGVWRFYLGPFLFFLFILGTVRGGRKERALAGLSLLSIILALGHLPFFRFFQSPAQFLLLTVSGVILGASFGLSTIKNRRLKYLIIGLVAADLLSLSFNRQFFWADEKFTTTTSLVLPGLEKGTGGHRLLHTDDINGTKHRWNLESREDWNLVKGILAPSFGTSLGVREARSHYNLTNFRTLNFIRRLNVQPIDSPLFGYADIGQVIAMTPLGAGKLSPSWEDFGVINTVKPLGRAFVWPLQTPVAILRDEPGDLIARAEGPGRLVASESYFPGWKAVIDDRSQKVEAFEQTFLSVQLTEGPHRIRFIYRPVSVLLGTAVTLLACLILSVMMVRFRFFT